MGDGDAANGSVWGPPGAAAPPPHPPPGGAVPITPVPAGVPVAPVPTVAPATSTWTPSRPPTAAAADTFAFAGPPVDATAGAGDAPQRSRGRTLVALVGVLAIVAAGVFAIARLRSSDDGGAATATEVGTQLTAALSQEDFLGVIDLLLPAERDALRQPVLDTFDHLRRLEVLSSDASLSGFEGLDIEFADVSVREQATNVADIRNIYLSGSSTVSVDGERIPLGSLLLDDVFGGTRPDMTSPPVTEEFADVRLTVVERDGRWYLSAFYSVAESIRLESGGDIPTEGLAPSGASSPEAAVQQLVERMARFDLAGVLGVLDPAEFEALHRYAPMFLADAEQELAAAASEVTVDVSRLDLRAEGSGSRRHVAVDGVAVSVTEVATGEQVSFTFADECLELVAGGETQRFCMDDLTGDAAGDMGGGPGLGGFDMGEMLDELGMDEGQPGAEMAERISAAFADFDARGIAVHEVGGEWFVSPLRSYLDLMNDGLAALDREELSGIVESMQAWFDHMGGTGFGMGGLGMDDEAMGFDPTDPGPALDGLEDRIAQCYAMPAAEGVGCIQQGIADGSIDPAFVAATVRFPQCGVAEAYWIDIYSMPDADFVALVQAASPCFLDLVAAGAVSAWEVPSELLAPQCVPGRNVYLLPEQEYQAFAGCAAEATAGMP